MIFFSEILTYTVYNARRLLRNLKCQEKEISTWNEMFSVNYNKFRINILDVFFSQIFL